jgi:hypothetical protein
MKSIVVFFKTLLLVYVIFQAGCGPQPRTSQQTSETEQGFDIALYTDYAPVKVEILPLTEFVGLNSPDRSPQIDVYLGLSDSLGSQIKSPAVFRFELYERVQRSAEPKGKRVAIWPDFDLTNIAENNNYWRDYLRAYEFNLDFQPEADHSYVLQVTCIYPSGKRISNEYSLKR